MDHGRILASGTPQELKRSVGADTIVTVAVDADLAELSRQLLRRVEGAETATALDGSVHLAVRGSDRVLLRVIAAADDAGFSVSDVQVAPPTVETVFIRLTGKGLRD